MARSCYHCCSGKAVSATYSECVFVALGVYHVLHMRHIVICGLSGCALFLHITPETAQFPEKRKLLNIKCILIFSTTSVRNISHSKKN